MNSTLLTKVKQVYKCKYIHSKCEKCIEIECINRFLLVKNTNAFCAVSMKNIKIYKT